MRAAELFAQGKRQVDVMVELEVSAQTASRWHRDWLAGGRRALAGAGRAGRLPRLSDGQIAEVEAALELGPKANGYPPDMWTLARVAEVIEKVTGVRYSTTQTWTILRERLGWSRQCLARRAVERDDEAIEQWVKTEWPRIKRGPAPRGPELLPGRVRILPAARSEGHVGAPRATHRFNWTRMSMSGTLAYRPDRSEATLVFQIKEGSYNTDSLIGFLTDLHDHLDGQPVTLIWDGLPSHRYKAMKAWLATQRHWLRVEPLPGYAHDLNPMEQVWATSKPANWPTSAPTPSTKPTTPHRPAWNASAPAASCASTSSTIPAFPYNHPHPNTERSLMGAAGAVAGECQRSCG